MELLYKFLSKNLVPTVKAWGVYVVSVILNQLAEPDVINGKDSFFDRMITLSNASILMLYIFTALVIILASTYLVIKPIVIRRRPQPVFTRMMRHYSDEVLYPEISGGVSWGSNKTVALPHSIVEGWKPQDIFIDDYDSIEYTFDDTLKEKHKAFTESPEFQSVKKAGNDLRRFMLNGYKSNTDAKNPRFVLKVKSTHWNQTSFVWNEARNNPQWKKEQIQHQLKSKADLLPNSLCLHLILETSDRKVLITTISRSKANDYAETKAVTIGEQVDGSDFLKPNDVVGDFISPWVQRAIMEEFGLTEDLYRELFDIGSTRVLGLTLEGDIINYSLPTIIRMKVTGEQFLEYVNSTIDQKEISSIKCVSLDEIPDILFDINNNRAEWHPSSYLRLLLYYLHRRGYEKTCKQFVKAYKLHSEC